MHEGGTGGRSNHVINNGNRGKEKVQEEKRGVVLPSVCTLSCWGYGSESVIDRVRRLHGLVYQSVLLRGNKPEVGGQQQMKCALDIDATTFFDRNY